MNNNGDNRNNYLLFLQFFSMSSVVSRATSRSAGWGGRGRGPDVWEETVTSRANHVTHEPMEDEESISSQ